MEFITNTGIISLEFSGEKDMDLPQIILLILYNYPVLSRHLAPFPKCPTINAFFAKQ